MRRRPSTHPVQLELFPASNAGDPKHRRAPRRARRSVRLVLTALALGIATAGMIAGSYAAWTAQTANPGNSVTSGTLTMSNNKSAASIFTATNVKPGDTGSNTVVIGNTGSIPMSVKLTQDTLTSSGIESSLGLKVHDDTRNWCYWPTNTAGACPGGYGAWNATASLTNLAVLNSTGGAQWAAGETHTFTVSWQLALASPNADQGKTGSFRLVWDGTQ